MMKSLMAVGLAMLVSAGAAGAVSVTNGSFEDGAPGMGIVRGQSFDALTSGGRSWEVFRELNGWTTVAGPGIEVQTNRTLRAIDAHSGTHYVELASHTGRNANSTMSQALTLGAGRYLLSFWYSPRTSVPSQNGIAWSIAGSAGAITGPGPDTAVGQWTEVTSRFQVAEAGVYDLRFSAFGDRHTYGGLIDTVSVAPVPLPASALMLLAGVAGLAAVRRRRA